ncbi:MAG: MBL fold metallo-hydrolase [Caldilineaceae bacterium]
MALHSFALGDATVTIFNVCDLRFDLADALPVDAATVDAKYRPYFTAPLSVPVQCIHIQLPQMALLVDAGLFDFGPDSPLVLPNYQPPPDLLTQMRTAGLDPVAVEHIIITHAHGDHFNALTIPQGNGYQPAFPNATVHLGRADWERPAMQQERADPNSLAAHTFGVLHQQRRLALTEGVQALGPNAQILSAPGETPGHQLLRVTSQGETLYCLGDLYHHPVEVEQPTWGVSWADAAANLSSRQQLVTAALRDDALLIATHITGMGRLQTNDTGVTWIAVPPASS